LRKTFAFIALFSLLIDRLSKSAAKKLLLGKSITIIPGIFNLTYAENPGAAFSILSSGNELVRKTFLIVIPTAIVSLLLYYGLVKGTKDRLSASALGLICGGALGNLYDRVLYGKVVDFLDFHFKGYHYPTFNVADACVFIGCAILLFRHFHRPKE